MDLVYKAERSYYTECTLEFRYTVLVNLWKVVRFYLKFTLRFTINFSAYCTQIPSSQVAKYVEWRNGPMRKRTEDFVYSWTLEEMNAYSRWLAVNFCFNTKGVSRGRIIYHSVANHSSFICFVTLTIGLLVSDAHVLVSESAPELVLTCLLPILSTLIV